jgi:hypothetical protein
MANQRVTIVHREQPGLHYAIPVEKYDAPGPQGSWRERGFIFANPALREEYGDEPTIPRRVKDRYRREERAAQAEAAEETPPATTESAAGADSKNENEANTEASSAAKFNVAPARPGAPQRGEGKSDGSKEA